MSSERSFSKSANTVDEEGAPSMPFGHVEDATDGERIGGHANRDAGGDGEGDGLDCNRGMKALPLFASTSALILGGMAIAARPDRLLCASRPIAMSLSRALGPRA